MVLSGRFGDPYGKAEDDGAVYGRVGRYGVGILSFFYIE